MKVYHDPVCQMQIADPAAAPKCEYRKGLYFFCSIACRNEFDKNPKMYIELLKKQKKELSYKK